MYLMNIPHKPKFTSYFQSVDQAFTTRKAGGFDDTAEGLHL
jgi:hypothetical protein